MNQGEGELGLLELGWSMGLLLVEKCRWFGLLDLNHIHYLDLSQIPTIETNEGQEEWL